MINHLSFRKLNGNSEPGAGAGGGKESPSGGVPPSWGVPGTLERDQTGSLSTLNVSDDDLSGITSPSGTH